MAFARSMAEALNLIMETRGWTQTRLARELGVSQPWVSQIVHGTRDCRINKAARLLAKVGWELRITPKADEGNAEDDPVKRREFVAGAASVFFVPSPKTTPFHDPSYVEQLTQKTTRIHYQMGGNSLSNTLLSQARKISSASANGSRELQSAASDYMRWGSYALHTAGQSNVAAQFAQNAILNANRAASPDKEAMAHFALIMATTFKRGESTMSAANKDAAQAVLLAQRGLRVPGISHEPRAYLNACLACGLANVPGNERGARVALEKALDIQDVPTAYRADIIGKAANAFRDIGERRKALKMLGDSVRDSSSGSHFNQAQYLCDQITVALDMREPELAASLMNSLSYAVPLVDSTMVNRQVEHVLRTAKPWETVSEVRDARTRLQSVRASSEDL